MRYEELYPIERSAALRELASGDRHRVSEAMVRAQDALDDIAIFAPPSPKP